MESADMLNDPVLSWSDPCSLLHPPRTTSSVRALREEIGKQHAMQPCQTGQQEGYMLFRNENGEAAKLAVPEKTNVKSTLL